MRTDLYRLVHKAQRHHLFRFAQQLGLADLADADTRRAIARELREIVEMLSDHARNEERYIHPLYTRLGLGTALSSLETDHAALERRLEEISVCVERERWEDLYSLVMRFIGEYLTHIDGEERAQAELLWPAYSDAELAEVLTRFKAERDPVAARNDLASMIPALNIPELVQWLRTTRVSAPRDAFSATLRQVQELAGEDRWRAVVDRLDLASETRAEP